MYDSVREDTLLRVSTLKKQNSGSGFTIKGQNQKDIITQYEKRLEKNFKHSSVLLHKFSTLTPSTPPSTPRPSSVPQTRKRQPRPQSAMILSPVSPGVSGKQDFLKLAGGSKFTSKGRPLESRVKEIVAKNFSHTAAPLQIQNRNRGVVTTLKHQTRSLDHIQLEGKKKDHRVEKNTLMSIQAISSPTGAVSTSSGNLDEKEKKPKEKKKKIGDLKIKKGRQHKIEDAELISSARKSNADLNPPTVDYLVKIDGQGNYFDKSFVISTLLPPITISEIDNLEPPKNKMSRYILTHYRNITLPPPSSAYSPRPAKPVLLQNKQSQSAPAFESGTMNVKDVSGNTGNTMNTGTVNIKDMGVVRQNNTSVPNLNSGTVHFKDFSTVNAKEGASNTGTFNVKHNLGTTGTVKELGITKSPLNSSLGHRPVTSNSINSSSLSTGTVNVKDFGTVNVKHSPITSGTVNFKELGTVKLNNSGNSGSAAAGVNTGTMVIRDTIPTKQTGGINNTGTVNNTNSFGTMVIKND